MDSAQENNPLLRHSLDEELQAHDDLEGASDGLEKSLERSLIRKLDSRMLVLVLIYILNYVDRNNASQVAARLKGFERDLHLEGTQFASILGVLYVGYLTMQIPSNIFLNYLGKPSVYIPCCVLVWGCISIGTGLATNFHVALVLRFILGVTESAFFPGALLLISKWYKRSELSQRMAILSSGSLISNAFGSLAASAILDSMEGKLGYAAWRWLFFLEGATTCLVAVVAMLILPDFPEAENPWLTPAERSLALKRLADDAGPTTDTAKEDQSGFSLAIRDWKVWYFSVMILFINILLSFNAYFPTLVARLGYSPTRTLLLCAPPWLFATGIALWWSRRSDRAAERSGHLITSVVVGIVGLSISTFYTGYLPLFLLTQSYAAMICLLAWASATVGTPTSKRAVVLALINTVGSLGNIFGSYIWPGPDYTNSFLICIFSGIVVIVMSLGLRRHLATLNATLDTLEGVGIGHRYIL